MRIVININYLAVGGSQSFALALARGLSEHGHTVFVYDFNLPYFTRSLADLNSPLLAPGAFSFHQFRGPGPLYELLARIKILEPALNWLVHPFRISRFRKFVQDNRIDIVSSHLMAADTLTAMAVQGLPSVKHCATLHGSYEGFPESAQKEKREITFSRTDGVIYLTPKNIEFLSHLKRKNPAMKMKQIYNGYLPQVFAGSEKPVSRKEMNIPEDAFVFIQVARGTEDKGWKESIEAFLLSREKANKKMVLLLVGDGDHLSALKTHYSYEADIIFFGYSGNPIPLIHLADAGLLPTYYKGESLPNSVIEYLFAGIPVLASDIGEIRNMTGAGSDTAAGYVFELAGNGGVDASRLADKMAEYALKEPVYLQHRANTKIQTEKFRMESCVRAYEEFFASLMVND